MDLGLLAFFSFLFTSLSYLGPIEKSTESIWSQSGAFLQDEGSSSRVYLGIIYDLFICLFSSSSQFGELSTHSEGSFPSSPVSSARCFLWPKLTNPLTALVVTMLSFQFSALPAWSLASRTPPGKYQTFMSVCHRARSWPPSESPRHHASPLTPLGPLPGGWAQRFPLLHGTPVDSDARPGLRNSSLGSAHTAPCPFSWSPAWVTIPVPRPLPSESGENRSICKVPVGSQVL